MESPLSKWNTHCADWLRKDDSQLKEGTFINILFRKEEEWFRFQDNQGNLIERKTEIRFDPLTGESSRLIFDLGLKFNPPDYSDAAEQTGGPNCPFCSENLLKMTPVFPEGISEHGRIFHGEAVVFPNLFPYSKHNGVVIFSNQHYVRLKEFTINMIKDALIAALSYIKKIADIDPLGKYASINWNYLPLSGGSILHPHIQVMVSESPTNYQSLINEKTAAFKQETGKAYYSSLVEIEKALGERWIGEVDNVAWMHAFSPKSHNDYNAFFLQRHSVHDLVEQDWLNFAKGLTNIFTALTEQGFASFNLTINISMDPESIEPIHARLIPRLALGILNTSDINFFQSLHQEPLSFKVPEEVSAITRTHFQK